MSKKRKGPSRNPAGSPGRPEETAVWIKTEPTADGKGWMVTVEVDDDNAISLDRTAAMEYAYAVLGAVAQAEYDQAVLKQLTDKVNRDSAIQLVVDLRKDRPALDMSAMAPLSLVPGVNASGKAFLVIRINNEPVGQWTIPDARTHALTILEAIVVADLDAAYLRCLKGVVGLEDAVARAAIQDLAKYR